MSEKSDSLGEQEVCIDGVMSDYRCRVTVGYTL